MFIKKNELMAGYEYVYETAPFSQAEMLGYVWDILNDDDVTGHGIILTCPGEHGRWSGNPITVPLLPGRDEFTEMYGGTDITCITAIFEYHGEPVMLAWRTYDFTLSIIIPRECTADIDEIEKNVIPDDIDHHPQN
jgi:hypothetical protein